MKKINIDRPQISSAEIKERQNFEDLLVRYKELEKQPFYKKYWTYMVLVGVFSAAGTYYLLQQTDTTTVEKNGSSSSQKTEITTVIKEERIIDHQVAAINKTASQNPDKAPLKDDNFKHASTNSFLTMADTSEGIHVNAVDSKTDNIEQDNKIKALNSEIAVLKEKIKQLEASQPMKPQEAKGNYLFKIDVLPKEFPKLTKYKGLLFEVPSDEKNFSPEFVKTEWSSGAIVEDAKGNYQLTLTKGKKSYTFKALPVFKGNAYSAALKEYNQYHETLDSLVKEEKKKELERNEFMK